MTRSERARLALTIVAALAAGGVAGAGVGAHLLSPAVAVSLAVLMGLAAGSQVLRAVLKAKRDAASGRGHAVPRGHGRQGSGQAGQ